MLLFDTKHLDGKFSSRRSGSHIICLVQRVYPTAPVETLKTCIILEWLLDWTVRVRAKHLALRSRVLTKACDYTRRCRVFRLYGISCGFRQVVGRPSSS